MDIETYLNMPLPCSDELDKYFSDSKDLVIFEIGACEGEDTIKLRRKFPTARIYAFEPLPKNIRRMKNNYKKYDTPDIHINQLALSDQDGTAEFHVSSGHPDDQPKTSKWDYGNKSSSLLAPKEAKKTHKWLHFDKTIEVQTERLDTFCAQHKIEDIDFMFLDVQGAELMVLKGAGNLLNRIKMIWMEVEAIELYSGQPLKNDVEMFMANHGFVRLRDSVDSISGDQLYIKKFLLKPNKGGGGVRKVLGKVKRRMSSAPRQDSSPQNNKKISYSQTGEDLIIKFIFEALNVQHPTYIDIGAHLPRYINNTAIFYDSGSRGINIEPDPALFSAFPKDRPDDVNLNIGIAAEESELDFYIMSTPTLNTFSKEEVKNFEKEGFSVSKTKKVPVKNINSIIAEHLGKAPDFISLDAEGVDFEILKTYDFQKFSPAVWCIETISFSQTGHGVKDKKLINYMEGKGYMTFADTYINTIFVKKDLWAR